jgi:hypothetical protein
MFLMKDDLKGAVLGGHTEKQKGNLWDEEEY